jgi:hypothetical protein
MKRNEERVVFIKWSILVWKKNKSEKKVPGISGSSSPDLMAWGAGGGKLATIVSEHLTSAPQQFE